MAVSEAQRLAIIKYRQEKRDQLSVDVPKGKRDEYKAKAASLGLSLSVLIQRGVEGYKIGGEFVPSTTTTETLTAEDRRTLERLNSLPKSTRAKFTGLLAEVAALVDKGGD